MSVDREKLLKRLAITLNQIAETAEDIARHQAAIAALNGTARAPTWRRRGWPMPSTCINVAEQQRLEKALGQRG
ncbi:MAG TPA: hypothetical protein VL976_11420 [Xanthobacteraceae bacterium]|nr:hypothetical protein [Xanthobacteraceae bacterium]